MRMWMVRPRLQCRNHLLGEHVELHMFAACLKKGRSVDGHVDKGQVDTTLINVRHEQLAKEMEKRGYKHASPLPKVEGSPQGKVSPANSLRELYRRCSSCRKRIWLYAHQRELDLVLGRER